MTGCGRYTGHPGTRLVTPHCGQVLDTGVPGLQCHSCGSLLHPERGECAEFSASNSSQRQTCLRGEACLLYTWSRSATETAQLRECFPTRVLLGSISAPLAPAALCTGQSSASHSTETEIKCS